MMDDAPGIRLSERMLIAGHEAGHAIVALHFGTYVSEIRIGPMRGYGKGHTSYAVEFPSWAARITTALAGLAAEQDMGQPLERISAGERRRRGPRPGRFLGKARVPARQGAQDPGQAPPRLGSPDCAAADYR